MTQEKEIPAYALQPARAPQIIPVTAVYHRSDTTVPLERQRITHQFEEDILVPDTKEDMMEILFMDANCDIMPSEKRLLPKTDDLLNFTGTVTVQTLYHSNQEGSLPIAIVSKIPYKYQWNLHCTSPTEGYFSCHVKNVEYMIINERKFRVKITLEIMGNLYEKKELSMFQSLEEDELERKIEKVGINCLSGTMREDITIEHRCEITDLKEAPTEILWQQYLITENYRQITSEKIVLNGFVYVDLLYLTKGEDACDGLQHRTERIEFTQFMPLAKDLRNRKWSFVKAAFCNQGLHTVIEKTEEGKVLFRTEGTLQSHIFLYEERIKEMVTDAYHLDKDFQCTFTKYKQKDIAFPVTGEFSMRDVVHLPEGEKAEEAVCCYCKPVHINSQLEKNRVILTGRLQVYCLWRDENGYRITKKYQDIQHMIEVEGVEPSMHPDGDVSIRECRLTLLNDRQIEFSCNVVFSGECCCEKELVLLEHPAFVEGRVKESGFMVITTVEEGESLWDLAKRYKTTQEQIRNVNKLDTDILQGKKLLIIR